MIVLGGVDWTLHGKQVIIKCSIVFMVWQYWSVHVGGHCKHGQCPRMTRRQLQQREREQRPRPSILQPELSLAPGIQGKDYFTLFLLLFEQGMQKKFQKIQLRINIATPWSWFTNCSPIDNAAFNYKFTMHLDQPKHGRQKVINIWAPIIKCSYHLLIVIIN